MQYMSDQDFQLLVSSAIDDLPEHVRTNMDNVAIVIAEDVSKEHTINKDISPDETLFGLYEGIPLPQRGVGYGEVLPDKITIFKRPILQAYDTYEEVAKCVSNTLWHELAHHFGYDEEWIAKEEIKRNKTL